MLIPLHWLPTFQALLLLAAGAAVLATLLLLSWRPQLRPFLLPALAVLGLLIIASALGLLKNRILYRGPVEHDSVFMVLRNAESLAWAGIPLSLAALRQPRLARACAALLGVVGLGLLVFLVLWARVDSLANKAGIRDAVMRLPGIWLLARDGNLSVARWLWFAGAVLLAVPTVRAFWRQRRGRPGRTGSELGVVLLGLALTSEAMAIFFWHASDVSDRDYTYTLMPCIAYAALLFVLGEGRITSARWAHHALGALNFAIALWLLVCLSSGFFPSNYQVFVGEGYSLSVTLPMLLLLLMLLISPILTLHLAARGILRAVRRRQAGASGSPGTQHLE